MATEDEYRLVNENGKLKEALRSAILDRHRVTRKCVDYDPAGSTYEMDWSPKVKEWAKLCGMDLDEYDPNFYCPMT